MNTEEHTTIIDSLMPETEGRCEREMLDVLHRTPAHAIVKAGVMSVIDPMDDPRREWQIKTFGTGRDPQL